MSSPAKRYAMKILMANVYVDDKKLFKEGLESIFYPTSSDDPVVEEIRGDVPENLNTLEKIAQAINYDENFYNTVNNQLEQKITEEEFVVLLDKNLPVLSEEDILDAIK